MLPIAVPHENGTLRSTDPLPLPGCKLHPVAISSLNPLARALNVTPLSAAYLSKHLPPTLFPEQGALRQRVRQIASALAPHAVVRLVDKGLGVMWGFCPAWALQELQSFMRQQGCHKEITSPDSIFQAIQSSAKSHAWPLNNKARLALLYLIDKAKSQVQTEILWRPIAASPARVISRSRLRVAARAFTCFVRTLVSELPACFPVLNLNDMGQWVNRLSSCSAEVIGEADCKELFNNVHPATVVQHMREASAWLKQRRRWRASTLSWSIHNENKKLDRAGEAKKSTFDFLSMDALIELVSFSLLQDNVVLAAGEPWRRSGAIPMGRPLSARSADLHCVWCCKRFVHVLRRMGAMSVTRDGILQWALPDGNTVALQQFPDNVMVAAKGPAPHLAMYPVRQALEKAWELHVLCPCRDKNPSAVCHGSYMGTSVRCMGVKVSVSADVVFCHLNPNTLDAHGQLKFGAPVQSFWATNTRRTTNVFPSALSSTLPFL